jgi:Peptidase family M28
MRHTTTVRAVMTRAELESAVRELASYVRPSASEGERRAAEFVAASLRESGCRAEVEEERAHGGYWWPLGLLNGAAVVAGAYAWRRRRSPLAAAVAGVAAAAVADDVGGGRLWFRRLLPSRSTWNVVAETGDVTAERTLVLIAHHDAAHSGLVFHPALPRLFADRLPKLHARAKQSVPIMYAVWLGPVLVALGALLGRKRPLGCGIALAAGAVAAMADIGRADVVPGANDNLSAVAAVLALARRPPEGLRLILVSTGSEESFMEGMQGFMRRHADELDPARTDFLCLECLGGPYLTLVEAEGMLRMRYYTTELREALADAARRAGIGIKRGLRTVAATDALIPLRRGYRAATLASVDYTKFPANYHWPSDHPDNLVWETIEEAIAVTEEFARGLARGV